LRVLLIEEGLPIDKEFYLGIVLDRTTGRPVFMASAAGGMDIEEVAAHTPEKIFKETVDPAVGFRPFQARKLAFALACPRNSSIKPRSSCSLSTRLTSRWTPPCLRSTLSC